MKTKKIISFISIVFVACISIFVISSLSKSSSGIDQITSTNPVQDEKFIIGAFHDGGYYSTLNYQYLDQLKFNTWHHYTAPTSWGWKLDPNDKYNLPISGYQQLVQGVIADNNQHNLRTFMDRPIIEYLVGAIELIINASLSR